ncbi:prolipoprotein diacylglyceryl transferase [Candidatus Ishikawella capsulata]|uniref:Phosphatidylglycerol--prolipoprotein diacylglyceryl transferase n=1 Tax=Candidatus Ishikawaella capsulata Mpkobe TaxID=476281 RepID=C5WCC3_9ENTR|nr:prolipoprotein diacylglyceryl transferase [Candidatus Ishikawaella capsulata]BAH82979.1 prolipoprotein diacylglyceryl transferase [Candidatus Ishikawaella capsulata Mpkobe]
MINYITLPKINPIFLSIGPLSFHWYGLMYVIGFIFAKWLALRYVRKPHSDWKEDEVQNLLCLSFIAAIVGGRIGYVLIYRFDLFIKDPLFMFKIWNGGMSFHGGLIGVIFIVFCFSYSTNRDFLKISDFIAPLVPFGLGAGRLGNFINGELYGRVAPNIPWAMLFHNSYNEDLNFVKIHPEYQKMLNIYSVLPRHPSQIYELMLEGVLLFIIIKIFICKPRPRGSTSGVFLISYGLFRIILEFFRQPDPQLGLFHKIISMGQILSIPMIISGVIIVIWSYHYHECYKI